MFHTTNVSRRKKVVVKDAITKVSGELLLSDLILAGRCLQCTKCGLICFSK